MVLCSYNKYDVIFYPFFIVEVFYPFLIVEVSNIIFVLTGGFAFVFVAQDVTSGKDYALKVNNCHVMCYVTSDKDCALKVNNYHMTCHVTSGKDCFKGK